MTQKDKAEKKATGYRNKSAGWTRKSGQTETHRKGRRKAKKEAGHARRRYSKAEVQQAAREMKPGGLRDVDAGVYEVPEEQQAWDDLVGICIASSQACLTSIAAHMPLSVARYKRLQEIFDELHTLQQEIVS